MKRIAYWAMSTLTLVVMLFSYHTSTEAVAAGGSKTAVQQSSSSTDTQTEASQTTTSGTGGDGTSGGTTSGSSGSSSTATSASKTYTGTSVDTRWGPVQVQITVANGKITKSEAIVYPTENPRDQEINSYAVPTLNADAVTKQSSSLDMVSGATYTSNGYIQSLQSAIDEAKL